MKLKMSHDIAQNLVLKDINLGSCNNYYKRKAENWKKNGKLSTTTMPWKSYSLKQLSTRSQCHPSHERMFFFLVKAMRECQFVHVKQIHVSLCSLTAREDFHEKDIQQRWISNYLQDGTTDSSRTGSICTHVVHNILVLYPRKQDESISTLLSEINA